MGNGFTSFNEFRSAIKLGSGLQSQVEDMADEIYQLEMTEDSDSMWDAFESDEE